MELTCGPLQLLTPDPLCFCYFSPRSFDFCGPFLFLFYLLPLKKSQNSIKKNDNLKVCRRTI